jgi:hypothetical protein
MRVSQFTVKAASFGYNPQGKRSFETAEALALDSLC